VGVAYPTMEAIAESSRSTSRAASQSVQRPEQVLESVSFITARGRLTEGGPGANGSIIKQSINVEGERFGAGQEAALGIHELRGLDGPLVTSGFGHLPCGDSGAGADIPVVPCRHAAHEARQMMYVALPGRGTAVLSGR